MNRSAVLCSLTAFFLVSAGLHAEPLTCSNPTIQDFLKKEAKDALLQVARGIHEPKVSEDEFRIEFKDAYETNRSEFTRECSATLLFAKDLGDSSEINYTAIRTEAGNLLVKWLGTDAWAKAAYFDLVLKTGLDEVKKKHPELSKEQQYQILIYGEPANQNDPTASKPKSPPYAADPNWSQWHR